MSNASKQEYFDSIKERYQNSTKQKILDEFCSTCGYNRKDCFSQNRDHNDSQESFNFDKN